MQISGKHPYIFIDPNKKEVVEKDLTADKLNALTLMGRGSFVSLSRYREYRLIHDGKREDGEEYVYYTKCVVTHSTDSSKLTRCQTVGTVEKITLAVFLNDHSCFHWPEKTPPCEEKRQEALACMNKNEGRKKIYAETQRTAKEGFYGEGGFTQLNESTTKMMIEGHCRYNKTDLEPLPSDHSNFTTHFSFVEKNPLDVAKEHVEKKLNPLVLNPTLASRAGSGSQRGHTTPETALLYQSNYFEALFPSEKKFYPIRGPESIYTPHVQVFRGPETNASDSYQYITPYHISIVAVAAIGIEQFKPVGFDEITDDKVRMIPATAARHRHTSLIIPPFGCNNAHHNDPKEMAARFGKVFLSTEFKNRFQEVVFTIENEIQLPIFRDAILFPVTQSRLDYSNALFNELVNQYQQGQAEQDALFIALKEVRKEICKETHRTADEGYYLDGNYIKLDAELTRKMISGQFCFTFTEEVRDSLGLNPKHETIIEFFDEDILDLAEKYLKMGLNPVVMNPAHPKCVGGGWDLGAGTLEESLIYRSNYHLALINHGKNHYPLEEGQVIYTPFVQAFRARERNVHKSDEKMSYQYRHPFAISITACPAVSVRNKEKLPYLYKEDMLQNIKSFLTVAALQGHDSLVLCALGCGAFNGPPEIVAGLMKEAIQSELFRGQFKRIGFGIIRNESLLNTFREVFSSVD